VVAALDGINPRSMWTVLIAVVAIGSGIATLRTDHKILSLTLIVVGGLFVIMSGAKAARLSQLARATRRNKVSAYRQVLSTLVKDDARPFEERLEVEYHVGTTSRDDKVVRKAWTRATPETQRLHYRWVSERQPNSRMTRPVDPEDVNFTAEIAEPRHPRVVSLNSEHGQMKALVQFDPALVETEAEWSVSYDWPGMWDPLRDTGEGIATFRLTEPTAIWRGLKISFLFPKGASGVAFVASPRLGTVVPAVAVAGEGPTLGWYLDEPAAGSAFEFRFTAVIKK
jgi:hypothetical protein